MKGQKALYGAIWRWHFYAGLLSLPVLVLLATTGGLYLFKDEITDLVYAPLVVVEPGAAAPLPASQLTGTAATAAGGQPTGYMPPAAAGRSARVHVGLANGAEREVFVDPYSGQVLGELAKGDYGNLPLMHFVRYLHSLELAGWPGNALIEIVAGWTLVLVITGIWLWWPRGQSGGVFRLRRKSGVRVFWRDLHAVTGLGAGAVIFFLAATGMPWSGVWGANFGKAINAAGFGYPAGYWFPVAESPPPLADILTPTPWALANAPVPQSTPPPAATASSTAGLSDRTAVSSPLGVDSVIDRLEALGIPPGYTLAFPRGPTGVYSASVIPDRVEGARVIHLDQYSGAVLFDARYADLGAAARLVEFGTSIHTGQQFGRFNQFLMLAACIAIVVMAVAAVAMWWQRRPTGSLGAPPLPADFRLPRGILIIAVVFGLFFPLLGLSLVIALVVDRIVVWQSRVRPA